CWDPLALTETQAVLGGAASYGESAEDCLTRSRVAVIVNPLREFETVDWSRASQTVVVDCWRCLPTAQIPRVGHYVALGHGPDRNVSDWVGQLLGDYFDVLTN